MPEEDDSKTIGRWRRAASAQAALVVGFALLLGTCGSSPQPPPTAPEPPKQAPAPAGPKRTGGPVIVAFGDSLTAGYGVDAGLSYPDFLHQELERQGYLYDVVNMGLSGDTSAGGVDRLAAALELKPEIVILELGANDGLRGLPVSLTRSNLELMIQRFQEGGAKVVLAGITLPPNYGAAYIRAFEQMYKDLAKQYKLTLIPFLLDGVAGNPALMQQDGLHPTAEGNRKVAALVLRYLEPLLRRR